MKQFPREKPIEEQLVWIYWANHKQMAYYKDGVFRDIHLGMLRFDYREYKWEYLN